MGTNQDKALLIAGFFLVIFFSGIWLSRFEKPYPSMLFTVHKLIGVAAGILLGIVVYRTHQVAPLGAAEMAAVAVTVLSFVGTVASGGLLSVDLAVPAIVNKLHLAFPALTAICTAGTLYLLVRRIPQELLLPK